MDPSKFTNIAHRDHLFCSPLSAAKVDALIDLLELPVGADVLDVGCGKGEVLLRVMACYGATGTGLDLSESWLTEARARAEARVLPQPPTFLLQDANTYVPPEPVDLAVCIGSSHAYGGYRDTLRALRQVIKPGGLLLIGEGYWKQDPAPEYLALLEASADELTDHAGNVAVAVEEKLTPLCASVSSDDDWDCYEGLYALSVERYATRHPDDPDVSAMLGRIRPWRDGYLRWGRDTLGFALYLFQKPLV